MAKGSDRLPKLKSVLKRLNLFSNKQNCPTSSSVAAASDIDEEYSSPNLHPVYVGKSRRRYLISSEIVESPLFRELAEQSMGENNSVINVSCEVVLFEHLLWMLKNADPQAESLKELVEFYAC